MINAELLLILLAGTALMCIPIAIQMKWYSIPRWKSIPVSVMLVLTGVYGSQIWYFVENLSFSGRSLYGAIFFAPLVFWPVSKLLRMPYADALDVCAPAGCMTLAMVKFQCLRDKCCGGMVLYVDENHNYVFFPSQIVELVVFLIIAIVLMYLAADTKNRKKIFPLFLVIYGAARFVLSFLRETIEPYALGLSAGSFWSIWAFLIGLIWLKKSSPKKENEQ